VPSQGAGKPLGDVAIDWVGFCGTIIETRREFVKGRSACGLIEFTATVKSQSSGLGAPPDQCTRIYAGPTSGIS
jgi:hypothetical protein